MTFPSRDGIWRGQRGAYGVCAGMREPLLPLQDFGLGKSLRSGNLPGSKLLFHPETGSRGASKRACAELRSAGRARGTLVASTRGCGPRGTR
ncbi:hypothetical protein PSCLAVI8L_160105 [Pseudoclavibacter sp. 8L]|nr:hypothetical protein PSCLAVI8L_160105 [Pseudoclavibacter sp. 8L]